MKPPHCAVCGRDDPSCTLVRFADYVAPDARPGHPHGLEWFCARHASRARNLAWLSAAEAIRRLGIGG